MTSTKEKVPDWFKIGETIVFPTPDGGTINCQITLRYLMNSSGGMNDVIFDRLKIQKDKFCKEVLGYAGSGSFPETKRFEDTWKVAKALMLKCGMKIPGEEPTVNDNYQIY